jgi:aminomethyltransferase
MNVLDAQGGVIGVTTSGTFSPTLKQGIALALIDSAAELGEVLIEVRGRKLAARVVPLPLVPSHVR